MTCGQGEQVRRKLCVNRNLPCDGDIPIAVRACLQKVCVEEEQCRDFVPQSSCNNYKQKGLLSSFL